MPHQNQHSRTSSEADPHARTRRGIATAILATMCYALVDALSKYQARHGPVEMIVWARYVVPLVLVLAIFFPRLGTGMLGARRPGIHVIRGCLLVMGTFSIVFAYRVMPIAEAQAISFVHPLLLTVLAVVFLREKVNALGWSAVLIGFAGVLIIVRPGGGLFTLSSLLPLGLATAFSSYQIFTRIVSGTEKSINSLFWILAVGTTLTSLIVPFAWTPPTLPDVGMLILIGIVSGLGHFSTIKALEFAPASVLAPFAYVQLIWVTLLGVVMFGDFPGVITLAGMAVVAGGGLLVVFSKRMRR